MVEILNHLANKGRVLFPELTWLEEQDFTLIRRMYNEGEIRLFPVVKRSQSLLFYMEISQLKVDVDVHYDKWLTTGSVSFDLRDPNSIQNLEKYVFEYVRRVFHGGNRMGCDGRLDILPFPGKD